MKRWHQELTIARRAWKEHYLFHVEMNQTRGVGYRVGQREPGSDPNDVYVMLFDRISTNGNSAES